MVNAFNPGPHVIYHQGRPIAPGETVTIDGDLPDGLVVLSDQPDPDGPDHIADLEPPPRAGVGSGQKRWSEYAATTGHHDLAELDRDDLVDQLAARGVPTDPTPDSQSHDDTQDGDL